MSDTGLAEDVQKNTFAPFTRSEHFNGERGTCKAGCARRCFLGASQSALNLCPNYTVNADWKEPEPDPVPAVEADYTADADVAVNYQPTDLGHGKAALNQELASLTAALETNTQDLAQAAAVLQKLTADAEDLHAKIASVQRALGVLQGVEPDADPNDTDPNA